MSLPLRFCTSHFKAVPAINSAAQESQRRKGTMDTTVVVRECSKVWLQLVLMPITRPATGKSTTWFLNLLGHSTDSDNQFLRTREVLTCFGQLGCLQVTWRRVFSLSAVCGTQARPPLKPGHGYALPSFNLNPTVVRCSALAFHFRD